MAKNQVDVLIVGAGPAGLFLATQLSKLKINTRIVDKQEHAVLRGHADGLQCRTMEVFKALGVYSRFNDETHECAEVVMWNPDENGLLSETSRVVDTLPGTSHVRHVNLGQDRVEAIFMEAMQKNNALEVERLTAPVALHVNTEELNNPDAFPISVHLRKYTAPENWANGDVKSGLYRSNLFATEERPDPNVQSNDEVVECKYVVGCDGARSWVRRNLGLELKGDSANVYWGAFDAIINSDVPTLRMKNIFHSAGAGSVLTVPREDGLVRVYTQMGELEAGKRLARDEVDLEKLIAKTQEVVKPYSMEFCYVDWWTCYEIGQRMCDTFSMHQDRVLIAGDACHTHSPKAGQGMNVSCGTPDDSWNLGWKLASVLRKQASSRILETYHLERHGTAKELIDFDTQWAKLLGSSGVSAEDMDAAWRKSMKYTSGTGVRYAPNSLIKDDKRSKPELAPAILLGSHFPNAQVVCAANAHTTQLQECLQGDGRWRIIIFAGDVRQAPARSKLLALAEQLNSSRSPSRRFTAPKQELDSIIQILTVVSSPHRDIQKDSITWPASLVPERLPYNIKAVDTIYCDEESWHDGHGQAYRKYGIDSTEGCVVITRPDQYVSAIYGLSDFEDIVSYFESFMLVPA